LIDEWIDMSVSPRAETDARGVVRVPGDRLWGGQTNESLGILSAGISA